MKKKFEIFGRKVPILAVVLAVLIIGTASAAVFMNYATLSGDVDVIADISVIDSDGDVIPIGDSGDLNFSSPATFTIVNNGGASIDVDLVSTITEFNGTAYNPIPEGEKGYYSVEILHGTTVLVTNNGTIPVPTTDLTLDVKLVTAPNVNGTYNVKLEINPTV